MDSRVKKAIENVFDPKRFYLVAAFDTGEKFLLQMNRTDHRGGKVMLDPWYTIDKNVFGWVPDCAFLNTLGEIGVRGHVERALDQFSVMICCSDEQKQELMDRLGSEYSLSYVPRGRAKAYFFWSRTCSSWLCQGGNVSDIRSVSGRYIF